jgi:4-hydroxyphenylpyruvate dioxygenase-like putative hemolysin
MPAEELFLGYDHIAYATQDTDATVKLLQELGFQVGIHKADLGKFKARITKMVSGAGDVAEIVEPTNSSSVVSALLADRGATVYHTCFRATDFHEAHARMKKAGAVTITRPMRIPYPITEAHKTFLTCHMYHEYLGVFEITGPAPFEAEHEG